MEIEQYEFGKIVVNGKTYTDDIKIIGDRVVPHWYRSSGHRVEVADVDDVLAAKPDIFVLGKGEPGRMAADAELVALLKKENIELIEKPSKEAAAIFNQLHKKKKNVAAGFHLTC